MSINKTGGFFHRMARFLGNVVTGKMKHIIDCLNPFDGARWFYELNMPLTK